MQSDKKAQEFPAFWIDRVNAGVLDDIVSLYNDAAKLIPTFSPHGFKNREGITGYFTQLLAKEGLTARLHEASVFCQPIEGDWHVVSGIYSFEHILDGDLLTFPARFTFVIDLSDESPIHHHHSSQVPRTLS